MISLDQALSRVAERTISNQQDISQRKKQRRTGFIEVFGNEVYKQINDEGIFYISISPDREYFERYQMKFAIEKGATVGTVKVWIDDIELTDYFKEQHGEWINGEGVFPDDDRGEDETSAYYDVLDACGLLIASGDTEAPNTILDVGLHELKIKGITGGVSFLPYIKYSVINR